MDSKDIGSEQQQLRTAGEAGWHVSRYNLMAPVPDGDGVVIYNTFKRSCGEYNPIEVFLLSAVEKLDEAHRARRGAGLPLCGGGCPQLRLFGKRKCPPYKYDPEAFVLAMHARRDRNGK